MLDPSERTGIYTSSHIYKLHILIMFRVKFKVFSLLFKRKVCFILGLIFLFFLVSTSLFGGNTCYSGECDHSVPMVTTFPRVKWRNSSTKRILLWTGFFEDKSWENVNNQLFQRCRVKQCTITDDRRLFDESDAVLIHVGSLWKVIGSLDIPSYRHEFQRWVLYNIEPPPRTPLGYHQLSGIFNWTSFYRLDSDIPVSYGGYFQHKREGNTMNFSATHYHLAAWMSSNCHDYGQRLTFVREIQKYLPEFHLYGRCGGKRCTDTICRDTLSPYKFFFSIENSVCRDYITEKFWEALRRTQVPVVRGKKVDYAKIAPPHSYIHVDNFSSAKELAEYLIYLSKNPSEYNKYLKWTDTYEIYGEVDARRQYFCDLCEGLHDTEKPAQVYSNLDLWANDELEDCPQWTLMNQISRIFKAWKNGFLY